MGCVQIPEQQLHVTCTANTVSPFLHNFKQGKSSSDKKDAQLAKKLKEEELRLLFNDGISNQFGKKKSTAAETAKSMGVTEQLVDVDQLFSDSEDSDEDSIIDDMLPQFDDTIDDGAVEVFREKTIEDIIEEQRAKLAAQGKVGTPVTETSFARWYPSLIFLQITSFV